MSDNVSEINQGTSAIEH